VRKGKGGPWALVLRIAESGTKPLGDGGRELPEKDREETTQSKLLPQREPAKWRSEKETRVGWGGHGHSPLVERKEKRLLGLWLGEERPRRSWGEKVKNQKSGK